MLWGLLRAAEEALDYDRPRGLLSRAGPGSLVISTLLLWAALSIGRLPWVLVSAAASAPLYVLAGRDRIPPALRASLYPSLAVALIAGVLGPARPLSWEWVEYTGVIWLRVYIMASTSLIVLGELGPLGAVCVASRVHPLLHDTVLLLFRALPLTVRDTLVGAWAQRLLGKRVGDSLVGASLSAVRRADMLTISLYARGSRPGRREPPCPPGDRAVSLLLLGSGLLSLLAVLL